MRFTSVKNKIEPRKGCVACAVKILGDKWTALILLDMAEGQKRFCEFERSLPGISPRTLSQRLDNLTEQKIISKKSYSQVPPKVEYTLTDKGHDLIPVLKQMANWGSKYGS